MPSPSRPGEAMPDARRAFFAWRGYVKKRESTDIDALDHPLVFEGFISGYTRGVRDRLAMEAEVAGALNTIDRFSNLLEDLKLQRAAVQMVGNEEEEDARV